MSNKGVTKTNPCTHCAKRFPTTFFLLTPLLFTFWIFYSDWSPLPDTPVASSVAIPITVNELSAAISVEKTSLLDLVPPRWNEYRIGDGVKFYPGAPSCKIFPDSIVCAYQQETHQPNNISALVKVLEKRAYQQETHQPNNVSALVQVLEKRSKTRMNADVALVHVRLGDGLCAKVDKPCRGAKSGDPDCWNDDEDCFVYHSRHYAYSKLWYKSVILQLQKLQVKRMVIIGDKFHWTRTPDPRRGNFSVDEAYLDSMAHFFREHGFEVVLHEPNLPDSDFMYLCSAHVFVRGGGGYSRLVARVVENRGGVVIEPSSHL